MHEIFIIMHGKTENEIYVVNAPKGKSSKF